MKLYDYFRSSASFRVRIALNYKNIPYDVIGVNLLNDDQNNNAYKELNYQSLVPTLVIENTIITQSLAIIEYLDIKYPDIKLVPDDILDLSYVKSLAYQIACEMHPLNNLRVRKYLTEILNLNEIQKDNWCLHWLDLGFSALENIINNGNYYNKLYCYKNQFSLADICLIPQMYTARRLGCNLNKYPTLLEIENNCLKLDFVKRAYPKENV